MLGSLTPEQLQGRIEELTHAVNILGGRLAALMAYVVAVTPSLDAAETGRAQGVAQGLAPASVGLFPKTDPRLAASQGIEELVSLAAQQQTPPPP
jgi:hypothetical protein